MCLVQTVQKTCRVGRVDEASRRFEDRIRSVERDAAADGASLVGESAERLDERWQKAKLNENNKHGL